MGRPGSITVNGKRISFLTQSGVHVAQEKQPVKRMSSTSYGLPASYSLGYDSVIPLAVRVSNSGEFVHSAPWSVADQGRRNVSHGCINIAPQHAQWFYRNFSYGDIVDIRNTGARLRPDAASATGTSRGTSGRPAARCVTPRTPRQRRAGRTGRTGRWAHAGHKKG